MQTLVDLFNSFERRGNATAFIYLTGVRRFVYSYGDLVSHAEKTAAWLAAQGINKDDRVVLWAPNSPWWGIAFWGIILRGAVVVPVDFTSGRQRAEDIARLSGSKLVLQSLYKLDKLEGGPAGIVENLQYDTAAWAPDHSRPNIVPDDIAELVYTSGTTGDPKGVVLSHKNLMANMIQNNQHLPIAARVSKFLSLLPLSHLLEQNAGFLVPLYNGSAIAYLRTLKPSAMLTAFATEDIQAAILVPRLLQALQSGIEREIAAKGLATPFGFLLRHLQHWPRTIKKIVFYPVHRKFGLGFKLFISGGSKLDDSVARFWQRLGFPVIEGYGLTECSPVLAANFYEEQRIGSVGKPVPGVQLRLDHGEILAQGENIFSRYWQNEAATRAAFTADGWFKTGDTGVVDNDGWWYIKGRKKDLIVTGEGVNVYPEDLERVLNALPGVREACVVGKPSADGEQVHAVLVLDGAPNAEEIIARANSLLDPQQQITGFSVWPEPDLPKTSTLKVQKFKVLEVISRDDMAAGTGSADKLISLISQIVHKPAAEITEASVLVQDLGLTSVGRLELVNYVEQEFRLDMEDTLIDQHTTVGSLRQLIQKREGIHDRNEFHFWPNTSWGRVIRRIAEFLINRPIFFYFVTLKSSGRENLSAIQTPVIFIANHTSYFDHPAIMFSLPSRLHYATASAAWAEFFFNSKNKFQFVWKRFTYYYGLAAVNIFPLPQSTGFRKTFSFMGKLIDHKVNILIFPEGNMTTIDGMLPFMDGLGIIVQELQVPVVPIRIKGIEKVFPKGSAIPKKGTVEVIFGKPIDFSGASTTEILERSKQAIEAL